MDQYGLCWGQPIVNMFSVADPMGPRTLQRRHWRRGPSDWAGSSGHDPGKRPERWLHPSRSEESPGPDRKEPAPGLVWYTISIHFSSTHRLMGLTPRLVSKGHPWKWWIIGPLAKTRGFLLKPWVWGSGTTKLKPQLQLVVLVVRWLVGRLANSMVVDSSTRPRIAPASQKPLSLFGNGWEMEWNGTSFWLRALILLSCMQVPDICCHDRRLCSKKRQHVVLELGSKRSILLENMDLRTPKLFHKCMCNELFSGTASAVQTFSETLRLTLSGRQSFFVRHFPDACTCRSVASNPTCRHLSGICSKARKDLTVQSVEKKTNLNLDICRNRLFAKKTQKIKRKT